MEKFFSRILYRSDRFYKNKTKIDAIALFVFEFFDVAAFTLGGTATAAIALLEGVLSDELDALVLFLRGAVDEVVLHQFRPYPIA